MWGQHYEFHELLIFINFGRTDFRKGVSGAKFDGQADFEVRLAVAPQKPRRICKKLPKISKKKSKNNISDFRRFFGLQAS